MWREEYFFCFTFLNFIILILNYILYSRFFLVIYFIHINVYMPIPISQLLPPPSSQQLSPPWCPYICCLHLLLCFCLPKRFICTIFLVQHTCINIQDLFFSDWLHSVWQSLDPSKSLQMPQFHSFFWLSKIPFYICTTSLCIHLSVGI